MTSKLTADQLDELKETFAIYDINNDGLISYREMGSIMRALGLNPTEAEVLNFMADIDLDKDGAVNFEEFVVFVSDKMICTDTEEDIIEAFRVFDDEDKGFITAFDLRHVMTNLGEKLTEEEVDLMIKEADDDGDGVINYKDFVKIMTKRSE